MKIWDAFRRFSGTEKKRRGRPSGSRDKRREVAGSMRSRDLRMEQFEERMLLSISTPSWLSNHPYMSDDVVAAVERVVDLESYDVEDLAAVSQWVVGLDSANGAVFKADSLGADYLSEAPYLEKMSIWEFPSEDNWQTVVDTLTAAEGVDFFYPLVPEENQFMMIPNDTLFDDQWHLLNTGQNGGTPGADSNVVPAWDLVDGTGVVLGVVDAGFEADHPDLAANYNSVIDWDFGQMDDDPSPLLGDNHGVAVAGVAGAVGNNSEGVSGSAPGVELVGLRIDFGMNWSDATEASALTHENQTIDIYNNSWGSTRYFYPTGPLTTAALEDAVQNGRGGLGNIYLFAAGNSRTEDGNSGYDGESASRYTIAVAALDHNGRYSYYSNPGASLIVSAYSNSFYSGITTTDRQGEEGYNSTGAADGDPLPDIDYTSQFGGTSSASPLVSGIVALMLEANQDLTYRDVQSILASTAEMNDPTDSDWTTNAAGYHINHNYGFGVVDALAAVNAAATWQTLSEEVSTDSGQIPVAQPIPESTSVGMVSEYALNDSVTDIEWVEVTVDIDHLNPGDLNIVLTSPDGTESVLSNSSNMTWMFRQNGLRNWTFTSARHWGESSEGLWTLEVRDSITTGVTGTWNSWSIKAHGENSANITPPDPTSVVGPELISVKPNSGSAIADGDMLHVGPRELKFTFNEGQTIDEATLNSIKMLRAGGDDVLDNANDVVVDYGWIGLGERPNEVVVRFAETLPDDLYRITLVGAGDEPLMNIAGQIFHKGEDVSITFDLDLGALVTAIVPQPTYRDSAGDLQQHRDKVVIYFNSDTLDEDSAENPDFYRLTMTGQTADTSDDVEIVPQSVVYDPVANTVELIFSDDLANLGTGAFRLRIGDEWREIETEAKYAGEIIEENDMDVNVVGDTFVAALDLGMLGSAVGAASLIVSSAIEPQVYDIDWPGAIDEIGHRDLPLSRFTSSHYIERYFANDDQYGVSTITYNFQDHYGDDPAGNPLHNLISEAQKDRAREVFELYGHYLGVQFVETDSSGLTIATGDMRALEPGVATGPGNVLFYALDDVVIMDAAEDWNESLFGGDETNWFATAMQGIGHLLGLGYADDMDPITIMGSGFNDMYGGDTQYYESSYELVYPGNQDIVHGQHIFRPDSNDVDIYKFEIEQAGKFSAETVAERMDDSSLLDSQLKLYDDANNMIAGNDDYYSEDSYVEVYLEPGTYYVAVSSTGNDQYDPRVAGSGIGGTTQGEYDLRVSFIPDVGAHLSDTTGTRFDGDADGVPGGVHNFWFNVQSLERTIFVDKITDSVVEDGSLENPYYQIDQALAATNLNEAHASYDAVEKTLTIEINAGTTKINTIIDAINAEGTFSASLLGFGFSTVENLAILDGSDVLSGGSAGTKASTEIKSVDTYGDDDDSDFRVTAKAVGEEFNGVTVEFVEINEIVRIVGNYDRDYVDHVEYETGPLSHGLATGDLNGDGWKDIVTTTRNELEETNHVSILFGVGDGTFWEPVTYQVGKEPMAVEMGDIDGDGDLDILVANSGENTISRLGNLGDGTFVSLPKLFVGYGASDLAVGDLNGDGDLDIVSANTTDNTVSILLSNGSGGFLDQDIHDVGNSPIGVALGDVDNNQRVDVIVANSADDTINVLLNEEDIRTKDTEFEVQAAISVGANPTALAAGDLTGDGTVDVVVVNTGDNNISVLSGQGEGTFATPVAYAVGVAPTDVKLAAMDNNATLDVVVSNGADNTVSVFFTLPDESLETPDAYGVGDTPVNLALADLDNDGVVDIATANTDGDSVSVLLDHRDSAYEIGFDLMDSPLEDGWRMEVPKSVTVMVDAGAVFKLRKANIDVGSSTQGIDRSEGALQVLGTPDLSVYFTSFHNKLMGQDNAQFDVPAAGGDWGGLVFRNKLDYEDNEIAEEGQQRIILEEEGIFLNYVNHANITYGGGQVVVNSSSDIYNPLHMEEARPTLTYNTLTRNADAAMSADPNSFADTKFQSDSFTADYDRVGPEIHGNYIVDNSINGIFVRINTNAGKAMDELEVCARWDDLDITHVVLENLIISGTPGGPKLDEAEGTLTSRQDGRLAIDPGVLVKLDATRIEAEIGAQLIAEGNESYPIVFTSLDDDRYGMGGTFDTSRNSDEVIPAPGDWGGIYFSPVSNGSIDNALFAFAGGVTPIEGGFGGFNAVEIHQSVVRITDSVFEYNTSSVAGNSFRNGRNTATDSLIFVRGAQPIIAGNTMWNNDAIAISIDANSMTDEQLTDWGRSRGSSEADGSYQNNYGPLVRDNHLANNELNGMLVRGATLTTASVWDDTDIVHILQDEIVIPNHHTFSGLRLQSQADESLVVKLQGTNAGFTALGSPSEIEDRVGGTLQVLGAAGFPVVFTSLADDSCGAGYDPWGKLLTDTDNEDRDPSAGDWRSLKLERYVNDRNVAIVSEEEKPAGIAEDENALPVTSQDLGPLAWSEASGDDNLRLGFDVHGFIRSDDSADVDVYSFKAEAGVEVWLDIDRTTLGLDTVIELVDANGTVFARSDNSEAERKGEQELYGLARSMDRDVWDIDDQYTINPHDAGMRVVLPGPTGQTRTFFVRVSSKDGQSSGGYQLQVRLREAQEFSGSYINMSSIHYATNGIELLGLPTHSPLVGTTSEIDLGGNASFASVIIRPGSDKNDFSVTANQAGPAYNGAVVVFVDGSVTGDNATASYIANTLTIDINPSQTSGATIVAAINAEGTFTAVLVPEGTNVNDGSGKVDDLGSMGSLTGGAVGGNDNFVGAEYIGNLLYSDQNALQVSGYMDGAGDIDWYSFSVDQQDINPGADIQWPTVFDIDYADGMSRPDLALWVYESDGTLIYASDDSNLFDDQAGPTAGADTDDLDRGSLGPFDPYLGTVLLPEGDGRNYYVAVTTQARVPTVLDQVGARLEPITSLGRVAEDHVIFSNDPVDPLDVTREESVIPDSPASYLFNPLILQPHVEEYSLNDVALYVLTGDELVTVDPFTGAMETDVTGDDILTSGDILSYGDIAMRSDGRLFTFVSNATDGDLDPKMNYQQISTENGSILSSQITGIDTFVPDFLGENAIPTDSGTIHFNAMALREAEEPGDRYVYAVGTSDGGGDIIQNLLYKFEPDGTAIQHPEAVDDEGRLPTDIIPLASLQYPNADDPITGNITGLAFIDDRLYAVDALGNFYFILVEPHEDYPLLSLLDTYDLAPRNVESDPPVAPDLGPSASVKLELITTIAGAEFSGLARGPRNVEGGNYSNMLFATTRDGKIYALNKEGDLEPVFNNGETSIQLNVPGDVTGLAFSTLDYNLWHYTDNRTGDSGHGMEAAPDNTRGATLGESSFWFGLEEHEEGGFSTGIGSTVVIPGAIDDPADPHAGNLLDTYNLPGGAHGTLTTSEFSLAGYESRDIPMLYFNYFLETDGNIDYVTDSARVYISPDDISWTMLASNISTTGDFPENATEPEWYITETEYENTIDERPRVPVETLQDGTGNWHQAVVDLSDYVNVLREHYGADEDETGFAEAMSGLRLKFEFSSAGSMNIGQINFLDDNRLREGGYLRAVPGEEIIDGDYFEYFDLNDASIGATFEFDMGYSLVAASSAGRRINDGDTITIEGRIFEFTKDRLYNSGNDPDFISPIFISDGDSASDVAKNIAKLVNELILADNGFNFPIETHAKDDRVYLSGATTVEISTGGLVIEGDAPGTVADDNVAITISPKMTASAVAEAIGETIDEALATIDSPDYYQTLKVDGDLLQSVGHEVILGENCPLSYSRILPGDNAPGGDHNATETTQFYSNRRGQENRHEGFYIDDVVVGFAERGQMVTGVGPDPNPSFNEVPTGNEIMEGPYQLEIRTGTDYTDYTDKLINENYTDDMANDPTRSFDTNDRMTSSITIEASPAYDLVHGTTFTVNDGVYQQTFQFVAPGLGGVDANALPISFSGTESASQMATIIMQAINDADLLQTKADSNMGGNLVFLADAASVEGIAQKTFDQGGQGASAIEAVDLNGDDILDVITANELDGTVSVMLGDGIGWSVPTIFAVGGMPSDLAVVDVNGDSFPDIMTSNAQDGTVSVLLGNGTGTKPLFDPLIAPTFDEQLVYEVGAAPAAVTLADVDADGFLDIVTANKGDDTVSVLYGNGDGTFDPQVVLDVGGAPMDVAVADLDGNYMPDIVAANSMDNTISVLYEVGMTRFSSQETIAVGGIPVSLAIGDLNDDNAPDVVVANRGDGTATVLINDGSGVFEPDANNIDIGTGPVSLKIGDLDFDGALDIAVVNKAANTFTVAHGDGSGDFTVTTIEDTYGTNPTDLAFADLGTGGPMTLFVASADTQKFYVNISFDDPYFPRWPDDGFYEYFYGTPNMRYVNGDSNEERDQGQIIICGNKITDVVGWGIRYDSGTRDGNAANLPHPGSVMPQVEVNEQRLVPGVTIENNILATFGEGGILFSGDANNGAVPTAAVPFGRILNNTIYGGELGNEDPTATGIGIQVDENASPTILNNIISTTQVGISVDATSQTTVIGATTYQHNDSNVSGLPMGQHDMVLDDDAPLFVDALTGNFYPAAGSLVIDSSLDSLEDRPAMIAVRDPLGIPESPILAPERDLLGQARADDLTVSPPPGLGRNVFKDRGALDRLDFIGPTASVINPMDNQAGLDSDPAANDVFVVYGDFTEFTIQLADVAGVGIADTTVIPANLTMYVDGEVDPLVEGQDYFFSYDANIDQITLIPATGIWEQGHNYEIILNNSQTGMRDVADNPLRGNRLDKTTRFTIAVGFIDYGDAPDPTYPSLLENNGARHLLIGDYYLGEGVTSEYDAQFALDMDEVPLWDASGDEMDDGIVFGSALVINGIVPVTVTASRYGGYLDAWIDFNDDGDWEDAGEQIFASQPLGEGENELSILIPATVVDDDGANDTVSQNVTFARFRYSSNDSGLHPFGEAGDGEVEDYQVHVVNFLQDFGDAPGPYPTLLHPFDDNLSGAYHAIGSGLTLGAEIDDELDGQPNATATGDDIDDPLVDDEDGVIANNWLIPGQTASITVNASAAGWLNAWIDFNRDGDWDDSGEKIPVVSELMAGDNIIEVPVPVDAVEGTTYARFRFSSEQVLAPTGPAPDGEVEDYQFLISLTPYDFGDAPLSYPTMKESGAATLLIEQSGADNDMLLTAAVAGTEYNEVEVVIVSDSASGNEAFVVFSVVDNRLTIDVDPEATTANTVIDAIETEGTFFGILYDTTDPNNDGTGLVADLGNFGETDGGFNGDGPAAAHHLLGQGLYLGELVDAEKDGQAGPLALGDDENGEADEDGVVFGNLITGQEGIITVTAAYEASFSGTGYLNAWIDFDQDGNWTADEIIISGQELLAGENALAITIPGDAEDGMTFARFRFSSLEDLSFDGQAPDGEVEDYQVEILRGNATISGYKFDDRDYDSQWDPSEPGIDGMTIFVDLNKNGVLDTDTFGKPIEPFAITMKDDLSTLDTDETGYYEFFGLVGRQEPYILREIVQDGKSRLLIEPAGLNNDIQLIAGLPGEGLNGIEVELVDGVSSGDEATVVYDSNAKLLTIDIDPAATTANKVIAAINAEGTFKAKTSKINDLTNNGSGLVVTVGSMGTTSGGSNDAWKQTYPNGTVTLPDGSFGNADGSYTISLSEAETLTDVNFGNFHLPVLFLSDIKVPEGDAGYTDLEVTVHLQNSFGDTITVDYWTEDGTAIAALPNLDYQEAIGDLTFPAQPAPETPWEQEILHKGFSQGDKFQVSGDYVVWQGRDRDTDDWEIFLFDGTYDANDDPNVIQLTDNDTNDTNPFVVQTTGGVHVVWTHRDTLVDGDDTEIYFYDGTQNGGGVPNVIPLTNNAYDDRDPQVSETVVAWWAAEGLLMDSEIFFYEIGSGDPLAATINLSDNTESDSNPQVSGDYVVWTGMRSGISEIILFDGTYSDIGHVPNVQQVTRNNFMSDSEPQIDGEKIVWQRQHVNGNTNSYEVYLAEFDPGSSIDPPERLTNNSVPDLYPQIYGNDIVWQAKDEGFENDWEIMHYNTIAQTAPENITNNSTYDQRPKISGTQVVWQGFDATDWDVFTYELRGEFGVQNVSQNDDTDWYPEVSGSMIVWQSSGDEDVLIIARAGTPEITMTIPLRIVGDMNLEEDENFFLRAVAASSDTSFIIVDDTAEITILNDDGALDYGDAIDPDYPTLVANDGARHLIGGSIYLGDASGATTGMPDSEDDGQPSENADGDNLLNGDDEKGVVFDTEIQPGGTAQITITAGADCILNSWIDLNRDGDWDDTWADGQEQMFNNYSLVAGDNVLTFDVPAGAPLGHTYARFRVSSHEDIGYTGYVDDGEVEDYRVEITSAEAPPTSSSSAPQGSDVDDVIEFIAGDVPQVIINGILHELADANGEIVIDAGLGHDTVILRGTEEYEPFELWPDHAIFEGDGYSLRVIGSESVTAISGGGDDMVNLYDSAGEDTFTTTFSSATMIGAGYDLEATGFANVYGHATPGATDRAVMHDSPSSDTGEISPTSAWISYYPIHTQADGFEYVRMIADSGGNNDNVTLLDSPGKDTLQTASTYAKMSGDGFYYQAELFDRVTARSTSGNDSAHMLDSKGNDQFFANPTLAQMTVNAWPGLHEKSFIRAENFAEVSGSSIFGGFDTATLEGSADIDTFMATTAYGRLSGPGFSNWAYGFKKVVADGKDGDDTAELKDSIFDDFLYADENVVSLSNQAFDFEFLASSFFSVKATSTSEGDKKDVDESVDYLLATGLWEDI